MERVLRAHINIWSRNMDTAKADISKLMAQNFLKIQIKRKQK